MGKTTITKHRIPEIDILRGVAVFLMIFDHFMYDIWGLMPFVFSDFPNVNGLSWNIVSLAAHYWFMPLRTVARYVVLFVFLSLTGICCSFSKSNLKRGSKLLGLAYLLTLATYFIGDIIGDSELLISFGVLHCISLALIIIGLIEKKISSKWFYLCVAVVMISLGIYFKSIEQIVSYREKNILVLTIEQIVGISYCGSDCFPFLLNGGQIFLGVFIGKHFYSDKKSLFNLKYKNNLLTFVGRNSLPVYFAHQVIIPVLLFITLLLFGFSIAM